MEFFRKFRKAIAALSGFFVLFVSVTAHAESTVVNVGNPVNYPNGFPYMTHFFYMDGQLAYCLEPRLGPMQDGSYEVTYLSDEGENGYPLLVKVLACGYGGPNDITERMFPGASEEERYAYTHIAAGYAYLSNSSPESSMVDITGLTMEQFEECGLGEFVRAAWNTNFKGTVKLVSVNGYQNVGYLASYTNDYRYYIYKSDMKNRMLKGAVFELYSDSECNNLICRTAPTNDEGHVSATLQGISGVIYVKEVVAPYGYVIDPNVYRYSYNDDEKLTIKDEESTGRLEITKWDTETDGRPQGNATFENAEYTLYADGEIKYISNNELLYNDGDIVTTLVTDANGWAYADNLPLGKYILRETRASEGYNHDFTAYPVEIAYDGGVSRVITVRQTVKDEVAKGFFVIDKSRTGNPETKIEGAGFSAYLKSSLGLSSEGYDFDKAVPIPITDAGDTVMYTDQNGYAKSTLIPYGTYVVRETVVPTNYKKCEDFEVTIGVNNRVEPIQTEHLSDDYYEIKFRINKMDSESGNLIRPADGDDVLFNIFDIGKNEYAEKNLKLGKDGFVKSRKKYSEGRYRIEEIDAPNGYVICSKEMYFDLNENTFTAIDNENEEVVDIIFENEPYKGEVKIIKTGDGLSSFVKGDEKTFTNGVFEYSKSNLEGVEFELHAAEDIYYLDRRINFRSGEPDVLYHKDELIGKEKTDKNGTAVFGKDKYNLVYGKYYAVETDCPKGYVLSGDRVEISLKDNPEGTKVLVKEKKVNNKRQRFSLRINKYDSESKNNLKNVRFSLYAMEDIVNRKGEAIVKKGEYLASCLTDENGRAEFDINLPEGKYEIRETETPSGYLLSTKTEIVDLEYNLFKNINEKTEVIEKTVDIDNNFYKGSIIIEKSGEKVTSFKKGNEKEQKAGEFVYEESNLSGAEFALYAAEDIYYPDRRKDEKGELAVLYKKDTLLGKETTDENGKAYFSEDKYLLVYGDYYVTESDAPLGFIKSKDKILLSLKENMQNEKLLTKSEKVENTRQKLAISVKKTDKDSLLPLKGVGFNLYANEDIKNSTGDVIVGNKEYLASGVTDSDGLCVFDIDLPKGSYFVREVSVPEGYFVDNEPVIVETDYDNSGNSKNVKQVFFGTEVTNEMYRGEIKILKVGETLTGIVKGDENESDNSEFVYENKPLSGAVYALYAEETIFYPDRRRDEKGNIEILYEKDELIGEETTDDNGMAYFSKDKYLLVRGDYYIKEVSAPKGYILSDDKTVFSFKDNSENKKVILKEAEFKNPRQKFAVKVKKYAEDTNKPLKDAVFSVYADDDLKDADGNVIAHKGEYLGTAMSDEDGIAEFNLDLCAGRYVIKEIKAPEGYSINTDKFIFEFVKDKSNRDYTETIEVYDKKNPGKTKGKLVKGATETKVTKNNYRTEDIGTNGYSILLKRDDKRKGIILIIIGSLTVSTGILILLSALLKMIRRR